MRVVANFDPSAASSDTFNAGFSNGTGRIVVYNESNINLLLSWGSFSTYCPAWTAMLYCITANNVNIGWQQQSTLASSGAPISQVIVEAYADYEDIQGTFPAPLVRQTNIGNSVSTVGGGSTSVQQDNTAAGSTLVESTPTGAPGSTVDILTDGTVIIKSLNAGVLTTLLQLIAGASPSVKLAAAAVLVEVLGNFQVDGSSSLDNGKIVTDGAGRVTIPNNVSFSGKDTGGTAHNLIGLNSDNNTHIHNGVGGKIVLDSPLESTGAATMDSTLAVTSTFSCDGGLIGSDGLGGLTMIGTLSAHGASSLDNGTLTTDGAGNISKFTGGLGVAASKDVFDGSGLDTFVKARGASNIVQFQVNGATQASVSGGQTSSSAGHGAGGSLSVDKIFFNIGTLKDLNKGSISASGTVNHGLSGTPTIVLMCASLSGSTWTVGASTFTSTQFRADINTAANTNWFAYR